MVGGLKKSCCVRVKEKVNAVASFIRWISPTSLPGDRIFTAVANSKFVKLILSRTFLVLYMPRVHHHVHVRPHLELIFIHVKPIQMRSNHFRLHGLISIRMMYKGTVTFNLFLFFGNHWKKYEAALFYIQTSRTLLKAFSSCSERHSAFLHYNFCDKFFPNSKFLWYKKKQIRFILSYSSHYTPVIRIPFLFRLIKITKI